MKKLVIFISLSLILFKNNANAQSTCQDAIAQLQNYVTQVNAFANNEINVNIPIRCGWNVQCRNYWITSLNQWYISQCNLVNSSYYTIVNTCATQSYKSNNRSRKVADPDDDSKEISTAKIDNIEVDENASDKVVKLKMPTNPVGYR